MAKPVTTNDGLRRAERGSIRPFKRVLCANRGEIAIRVFRACTELGSARSRSSRRRTASTCTATRPTRPTWSARDCEPVAAYLADRRDRRAGQAPRHRRHSSGLWLPVRARLVRAQVPRGAGSSSSVPRPRRSTRSATRSRRARSPTAAGVPIVPGTPDADQDAGGGARALPTRLGYPVMIKASAGGGGRGMRVVRTRRRARPSCSSARAPRPARRSATTRSFSRSWSCGPKHIEVQILGDKHGNLVHLYERDCSVQRRHQKVVEYAPAWSLPEELGARLADDALKVARQAGYANAGTVEFLVGDGRRLLLHRGQPAHPGRAHGHRGDHRPRPRPGPDPASPRATPGRSRDRHRQPGGRSSSAAWPSSPRHRRGSRRTTFSPTPARSRSTGRPAGLASASTTARATSGRASRRTTTRCWPRSPPAASSGTTPAARWSAPSANSAFAA